MVPSLMQGETYRSSSIAQSQLDAPPQLQVLLIAAVLLVTQTSVWYLLLVDTCTYNCVPLSYTLLQFLFNVTYICSHLAPQYE